MRSFRLVVLAASLAASIAAVPAYASGGPGGGGGGGDDVAAAARPVAPFKNFRMAGALFSPATHALNGAMQYTLLPSGQVLVVGGFSGSRTLSSVELYDPASRTWTDLSAACSVSSENAARHVP